MIEKVEWKRDNKKVEKLGSTKKNRKQKDKFGQKHRSKNIK
jgi:hypothetical protein